MEPYRVPLYLSHRPKLHTTLLRTLTRVYCTSQYIQWGSSPESIGAVMILRPDTTADYSSLEWHRVRVDSDYADGFTEVELTSNSYVNSWAQLLSSRAGQQYVGNHCVSDGSRTCPNGRFYFYSLYPVIPFEGSGDFSDSSEDISELRDIVTTMTDVIRNGCHPYVVWDLQGMIPLREEVQYAGESMTDNYPIQCNSMNHVLEEWKKVWRAAGVPELPGTVSVPHANRECERDDSELVWVPESLNGSISYRPGIEEATVLPLDTVDIEEMLKKDVLGLRMDEPERLDYAALMGQFSHIKLRPGFVFKVKTSVYEWPASSFKSKFKQNLSWEKPLKEQVIVGIEEDPVARISPFDGHRKLFSHSPLAVIEGDGTPMSYFEATLLHYSLNKESFFGTILPMNKTQLSSAYKTNFLPKWRMHEPEPAVWHPHYYRTADGEHAVEFYVYSIDVNSSPQETIRRFVHVFPPNGYKLKNVFSEIIAHTTTVHGV